MGSKKKYNKKQNVKPLDQEKAKVNLPVENEEVTGEGKPFMCMSAAELCGHLTSTVSIISYIAEGSSSQTFKDSAANLKKISDELSKRAIQEFDNKKLRLEMELLRKENEFLRANAVYLPPDPTNEVPFPFWANEGPSGNVTGPKLVNKFEEAPVFINPEYLIQSQLCRAPQVGNSRKESYVLRRKRARLRRKLRSLLPAAEIPFNPSHIHL